MYQRSDFVSNKTTVIRTVAVKESFVVDGRRLELQFLLFYGGRDKTRTCDLHNVNVTL